ncbi:hypothetical protein AUJ46_03660 [Candidatus Peregrinibacteria bacterium CG1_02_54_53]|nr:MAG: hypothetical protein AUJ46_03660 [Candidatus Peregrinibacteria bacterium CG1_02_54_53]
MHLTVEDLGPDEAVQAFVLVQRSEKPEEIIRQLRGDQAALLDPEQFPLDVQRRCQELNVLPESDDENNEGGV